MTIYGHALTVLEEIARKNPNSCAIGHVIEQYRRADSDERRFGVILSAVVAYDTMLCEAHEQLAKIVAAGGPIPIVIPVHSDERKAV